MALGKIKQIENTERKFSEDTWYYFIKVKAQGRGEGGEEYWLATAEEAERFSSRGAKNMEDKPSTSRGVFSRVANTQHRFGEDDEYVAVNVLSPEGEEILWLLTENDLERLRRRTDANTEDIEANRESWLADLFD